MEGGVEQRQELIPDVAALATSAGPTESSGAGMAYQSCPKLQQETSYPYLSQSGLLEKVVALSKVNSVAKD